MTSPEDWRDVETLRQGQQACGMAFDLGRAQEEAAWVWTYGHRTLPGCSQGTVSVFGFCANCCTQNPYKTQATDATVEAHARSIQRRWDLDDGCFDSIHEDEDRIAAAVFLAIANGHISDPARAARSMAEMLMHKRERYYA